MLIHTVQLHVGTGPDAVGGGPSPVPARGFARRSSHREADSGAFFGGECTKQSAASIKIVFPLIGWLIFPFLLYRNGSANSSTAKSMNPNRQ